MPALLARLALGLLIFGAGNAPAREVVAAKAATSPTTKVKVAPHVLPANAPAPSKATTEHRVYSDLVDQVAKSAEDFADDNTSGNQGRDYLGDPPADAATDEDGGKAPIKTRQSKRP